jgi:hypothetical protein
MIYAVYHRYLCPYLDVEKTIEDAISTIQWGNETGEMFGLGVIDTDNKIARVSICKAREIAPMFERLKETCIKQNIDISDYNVDSFCSFPET